MKLPVIQKELVLQWHITEACEFRCRYCYIPHIQKNNWKYFPKKKALEVIDDFAEFTKKLGLIGRINFTGGNPLLHKDFFELAEYSVKKGLRFGILGNPTASKKQLKELKKLGIFRYQISIDGLKETHEYFRGKGSFKQAITFLRLLGKMEISRVVLSTVSRKNYKEIPLLIDYLYGKNLVEIYDFARMVPEGEAKNLKKECLTSKEFKSLLYEVFKVYMKLIEEGKEPHIGTKEPLWMLLYKELGLLLPEVFYLKKIRGGCSIGWAVIVIDVNGDVYPCRRLSLPIGNVFREPLSKIFLFSEMLNKFRSIENYECRNCELFWICRGCRAYAFAIKGNEFSKDPNCWVKR